MKRISIIILALTFVLMSVVLVGCDYNYQAFDTTYSFDRAIIYLPNGEIIDGKVDSWRDFEDGDQIQVKIDGVTYLVHSTNVVLVKE